MQDWAQNLKKNAKAVDVSTLHHATSECIVQLSLCQLTANWTLASLQLVDEEARMVWRSI